MLQNDVFLAINCDATSSHLPIYTEFPCAADTLRLQMDFVLAAFVDALCTTLQKKDLEQLQKLRRPWSSTVEKHYGKRRDVTLCLDVNHDGTQVGMGFLEDSSELRILERTFIPSTSLTKYDRIALIMVGYPGYEFTDLLEKLPLHRFKTQALPLITSLASIYVIDSEHFKMRHKDLMDILFSSLQGCVFTLSTRYAGKRCSRFIEQRSLLGGVRNVILYLGIVRHDRLKAAFITLLKSPKFSALNLSRTDVTIDFDMVACLVERFFRGDLPRKAFVGGKFSFDPTLLEDLHPQHVKVRKTRQGLCTVTWTGARSRYFIASFSGDDLFLRQR